jgi:drug/metabolite transporter (DMT)-like permease
MNDQSTVRIVIAVLGSLALAVVVGGIVLALNDKSLPGELIAIGSAAAGAVGGILSKTSTGPQEVQVVNRDADPVPVVTDQLPESDDIPTTGAPRRKVR